MTFTLPTQKILFIHFFHAILISSSPHETFWNSWSPPHFFRLLDYFTTFEKLLESIPAGATITYDSDALKKYHIPLMDIFYQCLF